MSRPGKSSVAARLRRRVTLQQIARIPDGAGGYAVSWQDVADLWAQITPLEGQERLAAGQLAAELSHRITLRYRADISPGKRLVYGGRIFMLRSIANRDEGSYLLDILAWETSLD